MTTNPTPNQTPLNERASLLRRLHTPGKPLILCNVYDTISARAIAQLPSCKALATASYAIAEAAGTTDEELDLDTNMLAVASVANVAGEFDLPLTADIQGGYGEKLEDCIRTLVELGVVGCNLEDVDMIDDKDGVHDHDHDHKHNYEEDIDANGTETRSTLLHGNLYDVETATHRIRRAIAVATECGVPDFVVNARTDTLVHGGDLDDAIRRGRRFLEAGATSVYVWGAANSDQITSLSKAFDGKLNVFLNLGLDRNPNSNGDGKTSGLTVQDLAQFGIARVSIGPQLQRYVTMVLQQKARELLEY